MWSTPRTSPAADYPVSRYTYIHTTRVLTRNLTRSGLLARCLTRIIEQFFPTLSRPEKRKKPANSMVCGLFAGAPAGTRTPDTLLKRQVLYLLSYWGVVVGASFGSSRFRHAWRRLAPSAAPPLKIRPATLGSDFVLRETPLPKSKPEFRFGKEEGTYGCAAFAALTQTAEAERSKFLLTPWLGWRDSNPLYRSQSPVCYHYTTSQCSYKPRPAPPASARFSGVGYGARTHDTRNHNPVLYQLS